MVNVFYSLISPLSLVLCGGRSCFAVIASATRRQWNDEDKDCLGRIMEATCYYNFPICPPPAGQQSSSAASSSTDLVAGKRLCRDDCHLITEGECSAAYNLLLHGTQLAHGKKRYLCHFSRN